MAALNEGSMLEEVKAWLPAGSEIVLTFPVLHAGWEMDERGWIVRMPGGEQRAVLTDHGSPIWADEAQLTQLLDRYDRAMAGAAQALEVLRRGRDPAFGGS
jgi:hypothetical protein